MGNLHGGGWVMRDGKGERSGERSCRNDVCEHSLALMRHQLAKVARDRMRMVYDSEMAARHAVDDLRRARRARMHAALLCLAAVVLCLVAIVAARNPHALGLAADDPAAAMGTKGQVR